ncbi:hypothetical protein J32TS6_00640 [Virgibacillus pantothenticus]|nr:hypothetical protein J32TS6_00640 [Virgibacillus pantothenticus]
MNENPADRKFTVIESKSFHCFFKYFTSCTTQHFTKDKAEVKLQPEDFSNPLTVSNRVSQRNWKLTYC